MIRPSNLEDHMKLRLTVLAGLILAEIAAIGGGWTWDLANGTQFGW